MKKILIITTGFLILLSGIVNAQLYRELMEKPGTKLSDIQKAFDEYWKDKKEENESPINDDDKEGEYYQFKRWEYFMQSHLDEHGRITNSNQRNYEAWKNEKAKSNQAGYKTQSYNGSWIAAGDTNYVLSDPYNQGGTGRVGCIAFDPNNSNIIYAGMPQGGIWKSTNGGATWQSIADEIPVQGISSIVISPANSNLIYALTGDGDAGDTYSLGIIKSSDGGNTWTTTSFYTSLNSTLRGFKLIMNPANPQIMMAVTSSGILRTTDGWDTDSVIYNGTYFTDIEFKYGNPQVVYAVTLTEFYKSTNGGIAWSKITNGLPVVNAPKPRIAIGVSTVPNTNVYLLYGCATGFIGMYRSTNSGNSFTLQSNAPKILGSEFGTDNYSQAQYDLTIGVDPANVATIYSGGVNLWKSTDYGVTWNQLTYRTHNSGFPYVHADQHSFEFNGSNIYAGCDGGLFKSVDGGVTFSEISNGMQHTQIYCIDGLQSNSNSYIYGTQDNGSFIFDDNTNTNTHVLNGDGANALFNFSNPKIAYAEIQYGGLCRTVNGGTTFSDIAPKKTGSFVTPYIMNPLNANELYIGYDSIFKSYNGGTTWTKLPFSNGGNQIMMAMGTNDTSKIYTTRDGSIWRSDNGGVNWINATSNIPTTIVWIRGIAVSTLNANDIWVGFDGYISGHKVFHSTNGGLTWTNISGSLPNVPVQSLAIVPGSTANALYAGTDIGVYYTDDNLGYWIPFRNGMPNILVTDMFINTAASKITAATFGRGIWTSDLYSTCSPNLSLTPANNPALGGFQYYNADNTITSSREYLASYGNDVTYVAGNTVHLVNGFHFNATGSGSSNFKAYVFPCNFPSQNPTALNGIWVEGNNSLSNEDQIKSIESNDVTVQPNPAIDLLQVQLKNTSNEIQSLKLIDINGKVVFQKNNIAEVPLSKTQINVNSFAPGVYLLKVESATQSKTKHVVIQ